MHCLSPLKGRKKVSLSCGSQRAYTPLLDVSGPGSAKLDTASAAEKRMQKKGESLFCCAQAEQALQHLIFQDDEERESVTQCLSALFSDLCVREVFQVQCMYKYSTLQRCQPSRRRSSSSKAAVMLVQRLAELE